MKKVSRTLLGFVLASMFILSSCGEKVEKRKEWLSAGPWKMVNFEASGSSIIEYFASCDLDNEYSFVDGGDYSVMEGKTLCDTSDWDIVSLGTWDMSPEFDEISIETSYYNTTFTIVEMSDIELVVEGYDGLWEAGGRVTYNRK